MVNKIDNVFLKKILTKQNWKGKEVEFDPDSSPEAWIYYCVIYNKEFCEEFMDLEGGRLIQTIDIHSKGFQPKKNPKDKDFMKIAGDCCFNFNDKKYKNFKSIIEKDGEKTEKKEQLLSLLEECKQRHHSLLNFSLIPVIGGMNNIKGSLKYDEGQDGNWTVKVHGVGRIPNNLHDRFDTFICFLAQTFQVRNELIKSIEDKDIVEKVTRLKNVGIFFANSIFTKSLYSENFGYLYDFLMNYEDIYVYCKEFYNIDNGFVDQLIDIGGKPLLNAKGVESYMMLANEYWKIQESIFRKHFGSSPKDVVDKINSLFLGKCAGKDGHHFDNRNHVF